MTPSTVNFNAEFPICPELWAIFLFLIVVATSYAAFGQSTVTGAISGVVTNPNKEVVPGASVTVKNLGTNVRDTATDEQGGFRIINLQPNVYGEHQCHRVQCLPQEKL